MSRPRPLGIGGALQFRIASRFFRVSQGEKALGLASTVRDVRQPLHSCALVVCRQVRVLARDCGALVAYDLARDKVGETPAAFSIVTALWRKL
jgi:hypothetical protein